MRTDASKLAPPLRVLVAVPDRFTQQFMKRQLVSQSLPVELAYADDGIQAFESSSTWRPELLILDLELPQLSGLELLELIRSNAEEEGPQVVVVTSVGSHDAVKQAISLGVSDYILKPYQSHVVDKRIVAAFERARGSRREQRRERNVPLLLVADRDPHFRDMARSALTDKYEVLTAATAGQMLTHALRRSPDAVFMSLGLKGSAVSVLAERLAAVRPKTALFLITDEQTAAPAPRPPLRGCLGRTFVPASLLASVQNLLESSGAAAPNWIDQVRPQVASAVRQTFGVMTGADIRLCETAGKPEGVAARLELRSDGTGGGLQIYVAAPRAVCRQIAAAMMGAEEAEVDEGDADNVLAEIANVVAGRIKQVSEDLGRPLSIGLPEVLEDFPSLSAVNSICFLWGDSGLFWVLICHS